MSDIMEFANREEFRKWLYEHCLSNAGVWLLFGKAGGPKTIKAGEALEEALCSALTIKLIKNIFLCAGRRASGQRKIRHWPKALKNGGL